MSATVLNLHEFIEDFRREVEALELHPSIDITGRVAEMHEAIERGDTDEFKRLIHLTQRKVADELEWEEDKLRSAEDPTYIPRCMRHG